MPKVSKAERIISALDKIGRGLDKHEYGLPVNHPLMDTMILVVEEILNEEEKPLAAKKKGKKKGTKKGC